MYNLCKYLQNDIKASITNNMELLQKLEEELAKERHSAKYLSYLPTLALEESGSSSTDNISENENSTVNTASSVPSTPLASEIGKAVWGHQRTWSTGIIPDRNKPSSSFDSNDSLAQPNVSGNSVMLPTSMSMFVFSRQLPFMLYVPVFVTLLFTLAFSHSLNSFLFEKHIKFRLKLVLFFLFIFFKLRINIKLM